MKKKNTMTTERNYSLWRHEFLNVYLQNARFGDHFWNIEIHLLILALKCTIRGPFGADIDSTNTYFLNSWLNIQTINYWANVYHERKIPGTLQGPEKNNFNNSKKSQHHCIVTQNLLFTHSLPKLQAWDSRLVVSFIVLNEGSFYLRVWEVFSTE